MDIPGHSSSVARPNRRTHFDIGTSSLAGPRAGPRHLSLQRFDAATPRAEASRPACQKPMIYAIGCCERMPKPSKALTRTGMFYDPRRNDHNLAHNPWTALVVPRPIGWISTVSKGGVVNLAPYSFFNTVSAHPPFVLFSSNPRKHSQINAEETGEFVVNMATWELREVMNLSSAEFGHEISEPERVGIEMRPCLNVKPPRVARSPVALECKYNTTVRLTGSDGRLNPASVIVGEV